MEVLKLIRLFLGWVFPYISRCFYTACIGEDSCILGTTEIFGDNIAPVICQLAPIV